MATRAARDEANAADQSGERTALHLARTWRRGDVMGRERKLLAPFAALSGIRVVGLTRTALPVIQQKPSQGWPQRPADQSSRPPGGPASVGCA